jgi:isopenicillin N synthase-like dioxygenase
VIQWPDDALIPAFRTTFEQYLSHVQSLSYEFSSLLAEAFGLPPEDLAQFYDVEEHMQHRAKIVCYPLVDNGGGEGQGVGPHYDAGFLTFVSASLRSMRI